MTSKNIAGFHTTRVKGAEKNGGEYFPVVQMPKIEKKDFRFLESRYGKTNFKKYIII